MKKIAIIFPLILIVVSYFIGLYFYTQLPYLMASHWGVNGQVNGYVSKNFAICFMPTLSLFMFILFRFLPLTDPYKKNFSQFEKYYDLFTVVIFAFLFYVHILTIYWNLGFYFDFIRFLSPAFAIIFYYAAVLMSHAKRNWFVGIRTPWTLSSDLVWKKTHTLGSFLFKLTALSSLFGVIFPHLALYLLLVPVISTVIILFIYSYSEYQKEKSK